MICRNIQIEKERSPRRRIQSSQSSRQTILLKCKIRLSVINVRSLRSNSPRKNQILNMSFEKNHLKKNANYGND